MKQAGHEFHSTNRGRDVDVRATSQGVATGQRERGEPTSSEARSSEDSTFPHDIFPGSTEPASPQTQLEMDLEAALNEMQGPLLEPDEEFNVLANENERKKRKMENEYEAKKYSDRSGLDINTAKWLLRGHHSEYFSDGFVVDPTEPFQISGKLRELHSSDPEAYNRRKKRLEGLGNTLDGRPLRGVTQQKGPTCAIHAISEAPLIAAGLPANVLSTILNLTPADRVIREITRNTNRRYKDIYHFIAENPIWGRQYLYEIIHDKKPKFENREMYPDIVSIGLSLKNIFDVSMMGIANKKTGGRVYQIADEVASRSDSEKRNIDSTIGSTLSAALDNINNNQQIDSAKKSELSQKAYDEASRWHRAAYAKQWFDNENDLYNQLMSEVPDEVDASAAELANEIHVNTVGLQVGEALLDELISLPQPYVGSDKSQRIDGQERLEDIKPLFKDTLQKFGGAAVLDTDRMVRGNEIEDLTRDGSGHTIFINGIRREGDKEYVGVRDSNKPDGVVTEVLIDEFLVPYCRESLRSRGHSIEPGSMCLRNIKLRDDLVSKLILERPSPELWAKQRQNSLRKWQRAGQQQNPPSKRQRMN